MEQDGADEESRKLRLEVLNNLWKEYRLEERMWLQKSRVRWLREGDKNTSFFHRTCKVRQAQRNLKNLSFNGAVLEEPRAIKEAVFSHFQSFFKRDRRFKAKLACHNLPKISAANKAMLEEPFSVSEIWETLKECEGNRAKAYDNID